MVTPNPYDPPNDKPTQRSPAKRHPRCRSVVLVTSLSCVVAWALLPALSPARESGRPRPDVWAETAHLTLCVFDKSVRRLGWGETARMTVNAVTIASWGASGGVCIYWATVAISTITTPREPR